MREKDQTKEQLIAELVEMRQAVSNRDVALEALRESEEQHRTLFETMPLGVVYQDADGHITAANPAAERILGLTLDQMQGRTSTDPRWRAVHEDGADFAGDTHPAMEALRTGRVVRDVVMGVFNSERQTYTWINVAAVPQFRPGENRPYRVYATFDDITARKRAEAALKTSREQLELIIDTIPALLAYVDSQQRYLYINQAYADWFGSSKKELVGKHVRDVLGEETYRKAIVQIQAVLGGKELSYENISYNAQGQPSTVRATYVPHRDEDGQVKAFLALVEDITERVRAESQRDAMLKALRESETRFRALSDATFEGIAFTEQGVLIDANQQFADMLACEMDQIPGMDVRTLVAPEDQELVRTKMLAGSQEPYEHRALRKDGTIIHVEVRPRMMNVEGRLVRVTAVRDITERARTEEALRYLLDIERMISSLSTSFINCPVQEIDERIDRALGSVAEFAGAVRGSVFLFSNDLTMVSYSHEWCADPADSQIDLLQEFPFEQFGVYTTALEHLDNVIVGRPADIPPDAQGEREWIKERGFNPLLFVPMALRGKLYGTLGLYGQMGTERDWSRNLVSLLGFVADILVNALERKRAEAVLRESEERLSSFMGSASDSFYLLDSDLNFVEINKRGLEIIGKSREEVIGKNITDIVPDVKESGRYEKHLEVMRTGQPSVIDHFVPHPVFGDLHFILKSFQVGNGLGVIASDITERVRAEEAMRQASRLEATATLAGGIAHTVNNLMAGVLGYAEMLKMDLMDRVDVALHSDEMDMLKAISESARQASKLAQRMLAYARGGKVQPRMMNLNDTIQRMLNARERALPPEIRIVLDADPDLWAVEADPTQMSEVVLNLLTNAVEAIENSGRITIATSNVILKEGDVADLKPGRYICLSMRDTGCGMSQEVQARLFEPFFTTKFQGRGMGLAAVYGIVENHGGHIVAQSEEEHGSTFEAYLPAIQASATASSAATGAARADRAAPVTSLATVLIVQEEEAVRKLAQRMVERLGYRPLAARSGQEAVEIARAFDGEIHLALFDVETLGAGGVETYSLLVRARPEMKAILCSSYQQGATAQALLDAGASAFIQKPFQMSVLGAAIREALGSQE